MIAWLAGGCSQKKDLKDVQDPFYEQWRVRAEEAKGTSPVEPPPVDEKTFEIVSPDPTVKAAAEVPKPLPNRKISMKMNNNLSCNIEKWLYNIIEILNILPDTQVSIVLIYRQHCHLRHYPGLLTQAGKVLYCYNPHQYCLMIQDCAEVR